MNKLKIINMKNLILIILFFILTSSMCKRPNIYSSKKKKRIKSDYGMVTRSQKKRIDEVQKPKVYRRNKGWGF